MSRLHATMSAWNRDETGAYRAEIDGWTLVVKWRPESSEGDRGFWWEAERAGHKLRSSELHEEIELAMAGAEHAIGH